MVNVKNIEEALEFLALNGFYRINANQVAYLAKEADVNAVYEYLMSRVPWVLKRYFEVMCPQFHSTASYERLEDIPKRWIECRYCHSDEAEFVPDPSRVHIVFNFNPDFVTQIKQERDSGKNFPSPMMVV